MKNVYIDWGIAKPHVVLIGQDDSPEKLESRTILESLAPFNAFLEAGCPHYFVYQLIEKGCEIYVCDSKDIIPLRGGTEKSDESDVLFIRALRIEHPDRFRKLSIPERRDTQLKFLMKKYVHFMMDCVRFKHRQSSYEREFGETQTYVEVLNLLEKKKKETLMEVKPLLKDDLEKVSDINGLGLRFLAGLLAVAHPKRFSTLSRYLAYCGYKESSWLKGKGKYNRDAKTIAWQITKSIILHKDPRFYSLYLKLKQDLRTRYPNYSKAQIHGMAINRTSTFLLKELYARYSRTA